MKSHQSTAAQLVPVPVTPQGISDRARITALTRFAIATSILNFIGHVVLGYEIPWIQPFIALAAAYVTDIILESARAIEAGETPRFIGSTGKFVRFLLPAHISGMTVSMFLYSGADMTSIVFASVVSIATKYIFRVRIGDRYRHFLNPSNAGLLITLTVFGGTTVSAPWQFLNETDGWRDLILPLVILVSGFILNWRVTKRLPLIFSWLGAFVAQAFARHWFLDANLFAILYVATGPIAFLFTFYMVSDPGTTPGRMRDQIVYGTSVGLLYGVITAMHVTYSLFWALFVVCVAYGVLQMFAARTGAGISSSENENGENRAKKVPDDDKGKIGHAS